MYINDKASNLSRKECGALFFLVSRKKLPSAGQAEPRRQSSHKLLLVKGLIFQYKIAKRDLAHLSHRHDRRAPAETQETAVGQTVTGRV